MHVRKIACNACDTEVAGDFPFPALCRLPQDDQEFIQRFVLSSGSLKEMAAQLGLSYPTVRNRLDDIIAKFKEKLDEQSGKN
jgi:hypothetical protein